MRKKIKSPDGKTYTYPGSIRVVKVTPPGGKCQFYRVEKRISWNPDTWVLLELSDYLYHAIIRAKCLSWVFCHYTGDQKKMLEKIRNVLNADER